MGRRMMALFAQSKTLLRLAGLAALVVAALVAAAPAYTTLGRNLLWLQAARAAVCLLNTDRTDCSSTTLPGFVARLADPRSLSPADRAYAGLALGMTPDLGQLPAPEASARTNVRFRRFLILGAALERRSASGAAEQAYRAAIRLRPEIGEGYYRLGQFYVTQGRLAEALQQYARGAYADPSRATQGQFLAGYAQFKARRWDDALESLRQSWATFQKVGGLDASQPNQCLYFIGEALLNLGQWQEAVHAYEQVVALPTAGQYAWPTYAAYVGLGDAYSYLAQPAAAAEAFDRALAAANADTQRAVVYGHRGRAYLNDGNVFAAAEDFRQAMRLDPNDAWLVVGLADAELAGGDRSAAVADYRAALKIDPGLQYAADQIARLSSQP
jgi:tetratricopeptide (TPR) repeat protein